MTPEGFLSNNAGGVLGGISTGQDIASAWRSSRRRASGSIALDRRAGKPVIVEHPWPS
jgi:chorismate synthase